MNDQSPHSGAEFSEDPLAPRKALSADALARRRMLLRGASGGAAALAALKPVGALATSSSTVLTCLNANSRESLCSVSGVQSAAHSFGPNIVKIPAKGKHKSYWKTNTGSWPSACATTCTPTKRVGSLFSGCSNGTRTMLQILTSYSGSVEADYISAYLNGSLMYATTPTTTKCFPYSSSQVKALWDAGGTTRSNARTLFQAISTITT